MNKKFLPFVLLSGLLLASCSGNENEVGGKATMKLALTTDTEFSTTRAIDEAAYANINNYTVTLYRGTQQVASALYKDWNLAYEVEPGVQYTLRASYGTESAASYVNVLCEGEETFSVQSGTTKTLSFQCKPKAAKVTVNYQDSADGLYAANYGGTDVTVKTKHMSTAWIMNEETVGKELFIKADQNEPVTLGFSVKDKEGRVIAEKSKTITRNVNPQTWLKIIIKPESNSIEGGKFGINVTINDQLTEQVVNIELPNTVFN